MGCCHLVTSSIGQWWERVLKGSYLLSKAIIHMSNIEESAPICVGVISKNIEPKVSELQRL